MERNQADEIRILHDEVKKRVMQMLNNQTLRADAFDEYGRERLLKKGTVLTADVMQPVPYEQLVRLKIQSDDPRLEGDLRLLEERTERQVEVIRQLFEEKKEKILATRWPGATATRASSRASFPRRTCRICPMAPRWRSCSIRWAYRRA
jgi:hypothetical protein